MPHNHGASSMLITKKRIHDFILISESKQYPIAIEPIK